MAPTRTKWHVALELTVVRVCDDRDVPASGYAASIHTGGASACLGMGLHTCEYSGAQLVSNLSANLPNGTIRATLDTLDVDL